MFLLENQSIRLKYRRMSKVWNFDKELTELFCRNATFSNPAKSIKTWWKWSRHSKFFAVIRKSIDLTEFFTINQLLCRIYQNFKLLIFVKNSVESIYFRFTTLNLECLDHFHQVLIHLAGFENFGFLQNSLVSSFAVFIKI